MEFLLEDIPVTYVAAENGPAGAAEAFRLLESRLPSLKRRRFYGSVQAGEYRACVRTTPGDQPDAMGLLTWVIPGGRRRHIATPAEQAGASGLAGPVIATARLRRGVAISGSSQRWG